MVDVNRGIKSLPPMKLYWCVYAVTACVPSMCKALIREYKRLSHVCMNVFALIVLPTGVTADNLLSKKIFAELNNVIHLEPPDNS